MTARLVVATRAGCHLCADACAVVERVARDLDLEWQELDITGNAEMTQKWGEYVPVVFIDGDVHDWFRVDEQRLRAALT